MIVIILAIVLAPLVWRLGRLIYRSGYGDGIDAAGELMEGRW